MKTATFIQYNEESFTDWENKYGVSGYGSIAIDPSNETVIETWTSDVDIVAAELELNALGYTLGISEVG